MPTLQVSIRFHSYQSGGKTKEAQQQVHWHGGGVRRNSPRDVLGLSINGRLSQKRRGKHGFFRPGWYNDD